VFQRHYQGKKKKGSKKEKEQPKEEEKMEEDKPEEAKQEKENAEDIFLVSQIKYHNVMVQIISHEA
jgi:hypothetical protein